MWGAILITLVAAAGNNIGKALQKAATASLPQLQLRRPEVVAAYLRHPVWLGGLAADLGGGLLMIAAFARAPVSVIQPVSSMGLVFMMLFSHFVLKEHPTVAEWAAAATASAGILCLGLSSEPAPATAPTAAAAAAGSTALKHSVAGTPASLLPPPPPTAAAAAGTPGAVAEVGQALQPPSVARSAGDAGRLEALQVVVKLALVLVAFGGWLLLRQRRAAAARTRKRTATGLAGPPHSSSNPSAGGAASPTTAAELADAAWCGLEAGACFGLSAAACRTGFQVSASLGWPAVVGGVATSVGLTSGGFLLQTRGFKAGRMLVVGTLAAAASMVSGVLVGLLVLGEPLPSSRPRQALRWLAWALILVGVSRLASGSSSSSPGPKKGANGSSKVVGAVQQLVAELPLPIGVRQGLVRGLGVVVLGGSGSGRQRAAGGPRSCEDDGGVALPTSHV